MEAEKQVQNLPLEDVLPNRFQPRIKFSEESIEELANSIKEYGVIQPIIVTKEDNYYIWYKIKTSNDIEGFTKAIFGKNLIGYSQTIDD